MDTIFLDTNSIRNNNVNTFFGNIEKVKNVSRLANIAIPSIVIEEIKRQKYKTLKGHLDRISTNYFRKILKINENELNRCKVHIRERIQEIFENSSEEFPYKIVDLRNNEDRLLEFKDRAIKNIAPFEKTSDKGFKDAYIYFTILDFLESANNDVFLVTNDSRLQEAFGDSIVTILGDIGEYYKYRQEYFKEDYFIGKLNEYFGTDTIKKSHILDSQLNDDDDWVVKIEKDDEVVEILVDFYSREIIEEE